MKEGLSMKDVLGFGPRLVTLATVLVVVVGGYLAWRAVTGVIPDDPTALDDDYTLQIFAPDIPDTPIRVTNNTNLALRIHAFDAADRAKIFARDDRVIEPGQTLEYERVPYVFHVWKSQFLDAPIKWTDPIFSDVVLSGDENNLRISAEPAVTTFSNEVDEHLKVCTYNVGDPFQALPLECWTLAPNQTADPIVWTTSPADFVVKVFEPALIDNALTTRENVTAGSSITIHKG